MTASPKLKEIFVDEGRRLLDESRDILLTAPRLDGDAPTELARRLHSYKGMALSLGLEKLSRLAHEAEDRLGAAPRTGRSPRLAGRQLAAFLERLVALHEEAATEPVEAGELKAPGGSAPDEASATELRRVPVPPRDLDRLLAASLELAAAHQRLDHLLGPADASRELYAVRNELAAAVRSLRQNVIEMRLLPVEELFRLLEPSVQRWAAGRGVAVEFRARGGGIRVDRAILERLVEPLGHALRNAIVHGIESPDARSECGKPPAGRLTLDVLRVGERLQLEVEDDGAGVRAESVLARARRRGVLSDSGTELTEDETLQLLCRPGMSSRVEVDELSGRGVGLSAARSAVLDLGGSLVVHSRAGAGFAVRIVVPARVALVNAFIARVDGAVFAIPVDAVREVARAGATRTATEIDLAKLIGMTQASGARPDPPSGGHLSLVLAGSGGGARLAVEEVLGPRELVVRPLGAPLDASGLPWAGAALLPEGGLALVLDVARLPRRNV